MLWVARLRSGYFFVPICKSYQFLVTFAEEQHSKTQRIMENTVESAVVLTTDEFIRKSKQDVLNVVLADQIEKWSAEAVTLTINGIEDKKNYEKVKDLRITIKNKRLESKKVAEQYEEVGKKFLEEIKEAKLTIKAKCESIESILQAKQSDIDFLLNAEKERLRQLKEEENRKKQEIAERNQKRRTWLFSNGFLFNGTTYTRTINGNEHSISDANVDEYDTDQWKALFFTKVLEDKAAQEAAEAEALKAALPVQEPELEAQAEPTPYAANAPHAPQTFLIIDEPANHDAAPAAVYGREPVRGFEAPTFIEPADDAFTIAAPTIEPPVYQAPAPVALPNYPATDYERGFEEMRTRVLNRLFDDAPIDRHTLIDFIKAIVL